MGRMRGEGGFEEEKGEDDGNWVGGGLVEGGRLGGLGCE